jgi:hypothetical protein
MSKYAVFFTLKAEAIARALERPSDRVTVVSKAVESAGVANFSVRRFIRVPGSGVGARATAGVVE